MKLNSLPGQHRLSKGNPRKRIQEKLRLTSTLKKPSWNKIIRHSLAYSCDSWCPPKIVEDFKNFCPSNRKKFSTDDEIEPELTTYSLNWNTTEVQCTTPSKKLSNPAQCPLRYRKSLKTFIRRSRAGCSGQQEISPYTAVLARGRCNFSVTEKVWAVIHLLRSCSVFLWTSAPPPDCPLLGAAPCPPSA